MYLDLQSQWPSQGNPNYDVAHSNNEFQHLDVVKHTQFCKPELKETGQEKYPLISNHTKQSSHRSHA